MRTIALCLLASTIALGTLTVGCSDDETNTNSQPENTKPATKTDATGVSICSTYDNLCPKPAEGDTTSFRCVAEQVDGLANKAAIATCMSEVTACANAQACFYAQ